MKRDLATLARTARRSTVFLLFTVLAAQMAGAATLIVSSTGDSGPGTLRAALSSAAPGDSIGFAVTGTIRLTSGELVVTKDVTILGAGPNLLAVDGNGAGRVFYIASNTVVSLSGLTVTNGVLTGTYPAPNSGGGIYNDHATLTISNCTLSGNVAPFGAALYNDGAGATANLLVLNSTFSANTGGTGNAGLSSGAGIFNVNDYGRVTASNCVFEGNSVSVAGGAIYNAGAMAVVNSLLDGNSAGLGEGGGIYNEAYIAAALRIVTCGLYNNSAGAGGAIFNNLSLIVSNSELNGNSAGGDGGAGIYNSGAGTHATLAVANCTLSGNSADGGGGGGIRNDSTAGSATLTLDNSTLTFNSAASGGGIAASASGDGSAMLSVSNCNFSGNAADDAGGGIYNSSAGGPGSATATIVGTAFSGNQAHAGGGLGNNSVAGGGAALNLTNCFLTGNTTLSGGKGGGGIYNYGDTSRATVAVANCTLSGNAAYGYGAGGAINNAAALNALGGFGRVAAAVTIASSTLSSNSAYVGGGIASANDYGSSLAVLDTTLTANSATDAGGGIYGHLARLTVASSTLSSNSAAYFGGGIWSDAEGGPATLTVANSTLSGNWAGLNGGGVANEGSGFPTTNATVAILNCTLSGNSVSNSAGGGVWNDGGQLAIGSTILQAGLSGANVTNNDLGAVTSLGYNLSSDHGGGFLTAIGDQTSTDPLLGPLQDNGGPTFTHALLCGSPAIDKGTNFAGSPTDQRGAGFARTFKDPAVANPAGGDGTDIGAFERQTVCDRPPVAVIRLSPRFAILPGDTNRFILAPDNSYARVILDGSQSSDADGDPLQFYWYADGGTNLLATGAVATRRLPVGPHTVTLVVSDGHETGTARVSFQIITPGAAVGQLVELVNESTLDNKHKCPLLALLSEAREAFERAHFEAGLDRLAVFQGEVRKRVAPLDAALANELIAASGTIICIVGDHHHHEQTIGDERDRFGSAGRGREAHEDERGSKHDR